MQRVWMILLWTWLCSWAALSQAATGLVEIPALQSPVTDLTATLGASEQAALTQKLTLFSQKSGSQIAILLLPTTQPEDIAQFGIRLAEAWKIGRAQQDDGVIVIVAKQDRKMRIEVGYGLEGAIPDVIAKRIIREHMTPAFKQGQFYAGLNQATDQLMMYIQGEALPAPSAKEGAPAADWMHWLPFLMFAAIIAGAVLKSMFGQFFGSVLTGGALALVTSALGATVLVIVLVAVFGFIFALAMGSAGGGHSMYGGYPGYMGGMGRQGGVDPFRGGGGGFGGGGASGDW